MKGPPKARPVPLGRSGRGGARTAGPGKKMGAPRKIQSARTIVKGPYRLPPDVAEILGRQRNATAFIVDAVRAYAKIIRDDLATGPGTLELETAIANCRCGQDYVIVNGFGCCPSGCDQSVAKISESEGMTIPG